jgi:hypothetical protein
MQLRLKKGRHAAASSQDQQRNGEKIRRPVAAMSFIETTLFTTAPQAFPTILPLFVTPFSGRDSPILCCPFDIVIFYLPETHDHFAHRHPQVWQVARAQQTHLK